MQTQQQPQIVVKQGSGLGTGIGIGCGIIIALVCLPLACGVCGVCGTAGLTGLGHSIREEKSAASMAVRANFSRTEKGDSAIVVDNYGDADIGLVTVTADGVYTAEIKDGIRPHTSVTLPISRFSGARNATLARKPSKMGAGLKLITSPPLCGEGEFPRPWCSRMVL